MLLWVKHAHVFELLKWSWQFQFVLAASCEERQRERIKEEKCRVAIKGGKLGEKVYSIRG